MKRQISISIFLSILLILLALIYIKVSNETKPRTYEITTEEQEDEAIEISQQNISYMFYAKVVDGRIVIYDGKTNVIYFETSIERQVLPEDIKEKLKEGIYFKNEKELYDFLESYSS